MFPAQKLPAAYVGASGQTFTDKVTKDFIPRGLTFPDILNARLLHKSGEDSFRISAPPPL